MQKNKLLFTESLTYWLKKKNLTQAELSKRMGVNPNTISQYKTGERTPPMRKLELMTRALGVSVPEFFSRQDGADADLVFVERVKPRPGSRGGLKESTEHVAYYAFHSVFIARKGGSPEVMKIIEATGDSMSPTLNNGDLLMVHLGQTDVRTGYVYLMRMEDELVIRRLENRPGGMLLIRCDNPDYDDIQVNKNDEALDIAVLGRMVWSCREY